MGFVFQFYNLIPDLTAKENVELAAGLVENPLSVAQVLREVGLEDRMGHFPSQLSGGNSSVWPSPGLRLKGRLLLCDEPTGAWTRRSARLCWVCLIESTGSRAARW